jgi:hypothetical protein
VAEFDEAVHGVGDRARGLAELAADLVGGQGDAWVGGQVVADA